MIILIINEKIDQHNIRNIQEVVLHKAQVNEKLTVIKTMVKNVINKYKNYKSKIKILWVY